MQFGFENGGFKHHSKKFTKLILTPLRTSRRIWMKISLTRKLIPNLLMIALANFKAVWKKKVRRKSTNVIRTFFYFEAYSRRENLKFEGIVEAARKHATSTRSENTEYALVGFLQNVLGIEKAKNIEFQRIHSITTGRLNSPRLRGLTNQHRLTNHHSNLINRCGLKTETSK